MLNLTLPQQRALNVLTHAALNVELAEMNARDIETDDLSRTLPHALQDLRCRWAAAKLRAADRRHLRARARVLVLQVPTSQSYLTQCGHGFTYRTALFTDYTVDPVVLTPSQAAIDTPAMVDARWTTLGRVNGLLAPLGLMLSAKDEACTSVLLLDGGAHYLASAQVRNDGQVDLLTDDGRVPLTFAQFGGEGEPLGLNPRTIQRATAGEFRPA